MSKTISMIIGIVLALLSVFFVFYTVRLLLITSGLTAIRPGGRADDDGPFRRRNLVEHVVDRGRFGGGCFLRDGRDDP